MHSYWPNAYIYRLMAVASPQASGELVLWLFSVSSNWCVSVIPPNRAHFKEAAAFHVRIPWNDQSNNLADLPDAQNAERDRVCWCCYS